MTGKTTIEWTHQPGFMGDVWNPTTGCTRVSAGCDNCYAFALHDKRYKSNADAADAAFEDENTRPPMRRRDFAVSARAQGIALPFPSQYDRPFSQVQLLERRLEDPLRRRVPTCYFVDSMADLFHEDVSFDFLDAVFNTMGKASQHRFLILTKRPERMREYISIFYGDRDTLEDPWPNIWLGTSVEDQASFNERMPHLRATPAALRFLSIEPLLGPLGVQYSDWQGEWVTEPSPVQWVIVGGESGPRARPFDLTWARSLRAQCRSAGVAFFMKQLGSEPVVDGAPWSLLSGTKLESHGRDMAQWPEDLRIREFPR